MRLFKRDDPEEDRSSTRFDGVDEGQPTTFDGNVEVPPTRFVDTKQTEQWEDNDLTIAEKAHIERTAARRPARHSLESDRRRASLLELLTDEPKKEQKGVKCFSFFNFTSSFHLAVILIPSFISMWYSAAVLFPPEYREKAWIIFWDNGLLVFEDGKPTICPRASICSEGIAQVILIALARLTAFASYGIMSVTFISKMQSTIHYLSGSYLRTIIPFEDLHHIHVSTGKWYGILAFIHMITHYIRYILRKDADQLLSTVHLSGLVGIFGMTIVICSMTYMKKFKARFPFELRARLHWFGFSTLFVGLLFHTERSRIIALIFW